MALLLFKASFEVTIPNEIFFFSNTKCLHTYFYLHYDSIDYEPKNLIGDWLNIQDGSTVH